MYCGLSIVLTRYRRTTGVDCSVLSTTSKASVVILHVRKAQHFVSILESAECSLLTAQLGAVFAGFRIRFRSLATGCWLGPMTMAWKCQPDVVSNGHTTVRSAPCGLESWIRMVCFEHFSDARKVCRVLRRACVGLYAHCRHQSLQMATHVRKFLLAGSEMTCMLLFEGRMMFCYLR